jgi:hypothetical protein
MDMMLVRYLSVLFRNEKRLKNKDIAFYASLNRQLGRKKFESERRNINSVRNLISSWQLSGEKLSDMWLEMAADAIVMTGGDDSLLGVICGNLELFVIFTVKNCEVWTWKTWFHGSGKAWSYIARFELKNSWFWSKIAGYIAVWKWSFEVKISNFRSCTG